MIRTMFCLLVMLLALNGCATATAGRDFSADGLLALQPGVSTIDDARRVLGEPQLYNAIAGTGQLISWQYVRSSANVLSSSSQTESRAVGIIFDQSGVMIRLHALHNVTLPPAELARLQGTGG